MIKFSRVAIYGLLSLTLAAPAAARDCGPDALNVSRTIEIGPKGAAVGLQSYPRTLDLQDHEVILTFDDGPAASTGKVLDALADACARATFFVIGRNAEESPALVKRAADEGHTIGHHSYSHPALTLRLLDDGPAGRSTDHDAPVLRLLDEEDGPALPHDPTGRPPTIGQPSDPTSLDEAGTGSGTSSPVTPGPAVSPGIGDAAAVATGPSRHRVEYGDNLWSIAEAVVTAHDGGEPDQRAIADYWVRLIERNRAGLADPDNPDLLFCGQLLELPDR